MASDDKEGAAAPSRRRQRFVSFNRFLDDPTPEFGPRGSPESRASVGSLDGSFTLTPMSLNTSPNLIPHRSPPLGVSGVKLEGRSSIQNHLSRSPYHSPFISPFPSPFQSPSQFASASPYIPIPVVQLPRSSDNNRSKDSFVLDVGSQLNDSDFSLDSSSARNAGKEQLVLSEHHQADAAGKSSSSNATGAAGGKDEEAGTGVRYQPPHIRRTPSASSSLSSRPKPALNAASVLSTLSSQSRQDSEGDSSNNSNSNSSGPKQRTGFLFSQPITQRLHRTNKAANQRNHGGGGGGGHHHHKSAGQSPYPGNQRGRKDTPSGRKKH